MADEDNRKWEAQRKQARDQRIRQAAGGAKWYYLVGALSIVYVVLSLLEVDFGLKTGEGEPSLVVGLALNDVCLSIGATFAELMGPAGQAVAVVLNLLLAGVFFFIGAQASKHEPELEITVFTIGMGLYALDTVLVILPQDWWSLGVHAIVLMNLYRSFADRRRFNKMAFVPYGSDAEERKY
ncbi:hypothetical protein ACFL59_15895 [Planctomycetota bacterium]